LQRIKGMGEGAVTILIKAPNQRIEDQSVHCDRSWTVQQLKLHLSEVYPSKPPPDGQKLIYSGQLLADAAVLSEILRTYEGHENNTIHLVCSYKEAQKSCSADMTTTGQSVVNEPVRQRTQIPAAPEVEPIPMGPNSDNELRRRIPYFFNNPPFPQMAYDASDPQQIYQQMLIIQQAYMQYMTQYMQLNNPRYYNSPEQGEPTQPQQESDAPPIREDEIDEEEEQIQRDWLEFVYVVIRIAVLFSFVYFYSSPWRFAMVTAMALLLYHVGIFRWRPQQENRAREAPPSPEEEESTTPPDNPLPPHPQRWNWLNFVLEFISSYFLSLIPD